MSEQIDLLLVPDDGLESENFFSDGSDSVIGISIGRSPVAWKPAALRLVKKPYTRRYRQEERTYSRIVDNFHGPSKL